jgi:hypothetical protein
MKRFLEGLLVLAITLGFLCLAAGEAVAKNPERPYRGKGESTVVSVGTCDAGVAGIFPSELWEGPLIATHSGRGETSVCITVTGFVSSTTVATAGQGVAIAANGDLFYVTLSGTTDFSNDPCVGQGTITVDGGTGRFADASGSIHAVVIQPWSAPYTCGPEEWTTLSGTIAY